MVSGLIRALKRTRTRDCTLNPSKSLASHASWHALGVAAQSGGAGIRTRRVVFVVVEGAVRKSVGNGPVSGLAGSNNTFTLAPSSGNARVIKLNRAFCNINIPL